MSGRGNAYRDPDYEGRLEEMIRISLARGSATTFHVANIAALAALPMGGQPDGSLATVTTVGALWAYRPASSLTTDGITIVNATGGGQWLRGSSFIVEQAVAQAIWNLDRANVSGVASDEGDGIVVPLLTKAEIARRVGGTFPANEWTQNTNVNFLSVGTQAQEQADPWLLAPNLGEGIFFSLNRPALGSAGLPVAFTGTLLAVTPKNTALGGGALQSTFTVATGAVAANMYLVNTTRGSSVSFAVKNLGVGNWLLKQPQTPFAPGAAVPTEVDTWANGDNIVGYALEAIAAASLGPQSMMSRTRNTGSFIVNGLQIGVVGTDVTECPGAITFGECVINGRCYIGPAGTGTNALYGCMVPTFFFELWNCGTLSGCAFNGFALFRNCTPTADTLFAGNIAYEFVGYDSAFVFQNFCIAEAATTLHVEGYWRAFNATIYGPGTLDNHGLIAASGGGTVTYNQAGMQLVGVATGYSMATTAGTTTIHGGIALSQANLIAAAGPAGFGGTATNLAGAAYTNNGAQP